MMNVALLHGLARTSRSMEPMRRFLSANGFVARSFGYVSTRSPIAALSQQVAERIRDAFGCDDPICFVTHSLGGILLRKMRRDGLMPNIGRAVMLSPPNQGSEVVDQLRRFALFRWMNGPAGQELGTELGSAPNSLGPVDFELGVITGDRSVNPLLSLLIPGPNDGKVAVARTLVDGMEAFKVVHASHPFIMRKRSVMRDTACFLKSGHWE